MNNKRLTIAAIAMCIFLNSCNSDRAEIAATDSNSIATLNKSNINNLNLKGKLDYKMHFLMQAVKEMKKNNSFEQELFAKTLGTNIQKNTVLLNDVTGSSATARMSQNKTLTESMEAFKNLENRDYNISFYIPFAERIQSKRVASRIAPEESIYIFEGVDNPAQTAYQGYILNEDGNFVSYDELITEEIAEEMADNGQAVVVVGLQDASLAGGSASSVPSTSNNKHMWINNLVVKDHKESWIGGASEIAIQMYKVENNILQKINLINGSSIDGISQYEFAKVSRKDVRNQNVAPIHSPQVAGMIDVNPAVYNNSQFFYVIYEDDGWPTTRRNVAFPYWLSNGQHLNITFGSSDTEYYNSNQHNNKISSLVENGAIKFNTILQ